MLRYGYISNGFADHTLEQMIRILRNCRYQAIGITLDHHHLAPFTVEGPALRRLRRKLEEARLAPVIETGARYVLDPVRKHRPSLLSVDGEGRLRRVELIRRAIEIAEELGARVVSLWSGTPREGTPDTACWQRLEETLPELLDEAQRHDVVLGFEPEPGMFIERLDDFLELRKRVPHPALRLTLDMGHLAVSEKPPFERAIENSAKHLVNVHIDDIRGGVHEHLPLGEGEIDFAPLLAALKRSKYSGAVLVELSRNSHDAPAQAQKSIEFLRNAEGLAPRV